jgi:hypothetical protein
MLTPCLPVGLLAASWSTERSRPRPDLASAALGLLVGGRDPARVEMWVLLDILNWRLGIQFEGLQRPGAVPQRTSLPAARLGEAPDHGLKKLDTLVTETRVFGSQG